MLTLLRFISKSTYNAQEACLAERLIPRTPDLVVRGSSLVRRLFP